MTSTFERLLEQINKNPTQFKKIQKVLELLLSQKYVQEVKLRASQQLSNIVIKIMQKVDPIKQNATYKYLWNLASQFTQIILHTSSTSQSPHEWLEIAASIASIDSLGQEVARLAISAVIHQQNNRLYQILSCQLILNILKYITKQTITKHYKHILHFLLQLQHLNNLHFSEPNLQNKKVQLKLYFQNILIDCLQNIQFLSIDDQLAIYNLLKDKVYSKLSSPLILSQFLLQKFNSEQQNPTIQIEVLSCLFILVGKYGLQLESFYQNLQKILSKKRSSELSLFRVKNSKRFLKLVEAAMRTSKVPFQKILKFCQLLLNQIMNQKSQIAYWALSFLVNLIKKHRQLQAHLSQFPQIQCLKCHYSAKVRSLIKQLSKNLNKSQYLDIQDFARVNCKRLCDKKLQQIIEKVETNQERLQFKIPKNIQRI